MPLLRFFRTISCFAVLIIGWTTASAAAETDTLPTLKQFESSGGLLDVTFTMKRESGPVAIGRDSSANPIAVDGLNTLTVCSKANPADCAQPYAGAVLKLVPGETLKVAFDNQLGGTGGPMAAMCMDETAPWTDANGWSSGGGLGNQHFHGLLTPPTEGKPGDGTKPFGDFILTCTSGSGPGALRSYQVPLGTDHPLGIDWFHPHIHGIAKPQVASGMAGMILVGDPACDPAQCSVVRPILLKDIQLVQVPGAAGPHWVNFADQDPGFCGGPPFAATNLGSCALAGPTLTTGDTTITPTDGRWVFSLNGAQYPNIVADTPQVWRVQNASANITYRLSLRALNTGGGEVVADAPFEVISLDGAGLAGVSDAGQLAPQTREILLMPGSRADLRVRRPEDGGAGDLVYQLVNEAFQAGFAPADADIWPHVALARVVFPTPAAGAANAPPAAASSAGSVVTRAVRRGTVRVAEPAADRVRIGVASSEAATLRDTPLMRALASRQTLAPGSEIPPPPPPVSSTVQAPQDGSPPMAHAMNMPSGTESRLARMARWLDDNCDGYDGTDARAAVDKLLETKLPGHQAISSDLERRYRYWLRLHFDPRTTHRRIYLGIQTGSADEQFSLGETFVSTNADPFGPELIETDLYGRPISATNPVVLTTFNAHKGLCALKRAASTGHPEDAVEQWELVNLSKEVHNFHIHQLKFTVTRDGNGQPIMRTPSPLDLVQLPSSLLLTSGGGPAAELQHDTIIVPRGVTDCRNEDTGKTSLQFVGAVDGGAGMHPVEAFMLDRSAANSACTGLDRAQHAPGSAVPASPDGSGMIFVNIPIGGSWLSPQPDGNDRLQPARFVFHCHILEHEDKGMMHRIAILDPSP